MIVCQWHLDFKAAPAGMVGPQFRRHSDALAPYSIPGSQRREVFRVPDERPRL